MKRKVLISLFCLSLLTGCSALSSRYTLYDKPPSQQNGIVAGAIVGGAIGATGSPLMAAVGVVAGAEIGSNLSERMEMNRRIGRSFDFPKGTRTMSTRSAFYVDDSGNRIRETRNNDFYYRSDYW